MLWAGVTAFMESWPKIFNPDVTAYTTVSLVIVAVAVLVKLGLGKYVKNVGEEINSQALVASGSDAFFDAIERCGELLQEYYPSEKENVNELPDGLVILEN